MTHISAEMQGNQMPLGEVRLIDQGQFPVPAAGDFAPDGLQAQLKRLPRGDFLLWSDRFGTIEGDAGIAHIIEVPDLSLTRQRSANQLYFGQLVLESSSIGEQTELIAVKPLDSPRDAAREYGATSHINGLNGRSDRPVSFTPLGFYREPSTGQYSLVTRYEHSVRSLDNVFGDPEVLPDQLVVGKALGYCASTLGLLHGNNVIHWDAQAKNMAHDLEGERVIDLTDAARGVDGDTVRNDVSRLFTSLNSYVDRPPIDYTDQIAQSFIPRYRGLVADSGAPQAARLTSNQIHELVE